MCLEIINKKIKPCEVGYKVFDMHWNGKLYPEFKGKHTARPTNRWLNEADYRKGKQKTLRVFETGEEYPMGWHVFHTAASARKWARYGYVVRKVKVRKPVAVGKQGFGPITVCKEIFIINKEV